MMKRMGQTGREMVNSGVWAKVGKQHYRHASGVEIVYDCNHWVWKIRTPDGCDAGAYTLLWVARLTAEGLASKVAA